MARTLNGVVVATKTNNTAIVEITRRVAHPKYKKLIKKSKKFTCVLNGHQVNVGEHVAITETRPMTKTIHFLISEVHKKGESVWYSYDQFFQ